MANHLVGLLDKAESSDWLLRSSEWADYVDNTLATENRKNETALGGRRVTSEANELKDDCEDHLVFEGNLAAVFRKLKEISFDIVPEPAVEEAEEQKAERQEELNEGTYLDSQYWKKPEMYSIENIEAEFE